MGDADAARDFARSTDLDMRNTLLLPDANLEVTRAYHVMPCPRVFVLDTDQTVRYVNSHQDDDPVKAAAATIDTVSLGRVQFSNTAIAFGLEADTINSLSAADSTTGSGFHFGHLISESIVTADLAAKNVNTQDFQIDII